MRWSFWRVSLEATFMGASVSKPTSNASVERSEALSSFCLMAESGMYLVFCRCKMTSSRSTSALEY